MNYLLDTHALLWWLTDNPTLNNEAVKIICNPENIIFVSSATAWEISIKKAIGKLDAPDDLEEAINHNHFMPLFITIEQGMLAGKLPPYHNDPFDRMLIAQSIIEDLIIITRDSKFAQYQVKIIPA